MVEKLDGPVEEPTLLTHQTFRIEFIEQARKLTVKGFTDVELADFFGVSLSTLYRWKKYSPAFAEALAEGKAQADGLVVASLYKVANGFEHPEEKIFCYEGQIVRTQTQRYYPPSAKAISYWLNNRDPEKWKNRQELTGAGGTPLHPAQPEGAARPKRTTIEIARRTLYVLQRAQDQALLGGPEGGEGEMTKIVEEKITEVVEE